MADTLREQIISAFTRRAGALSNLPVLRANRSMGETDDIFVSVWDGADQAQTMPYAVQRFVMPVSIECIWRTEEHSIEANAFIGVLIKQMLGEDRTFGGLANRMDLSVVSPGYPQDGSDYTTLTVIFNITYDTVIGDPYTQKAA